MVQRLRICLAGTGRREGEKERAIVRDRERKREGDRARERDGGGGRKEERDEAERKGGKDRVRERRGERGRKEGPERERRREGESQDTEGERARQDTREGENQKNPADGAGTRVQFLVQEDPTCQRALSPCTTPTEAQVPRARLRNKRIPAMGSPRTTAGEWPRSAQPERARATQTQCSLSN